jgi:hypothetical protein
MIDAVTELSKHLRLICLAPKTPSNSFPAIDGSVFIVPDAAVTYSNICFLIAADASQSSNANKASVLPKIHDTEETSSPRENINSLAHLLAHEADDLSPQCLRNLLPKLLKIALNLSDVVVNRR